MFLGPDEELAENGRAYGFYEAAIIDKYDHYIEDGEKSFAFYHNSDPKCPQRHKLGKNYSYIVFYNGKLEPREVMLTDDMKIRLDANSILGHRNARYALDKPIWSRYAEDSIFNNSYKGLVYMTPRPLSVEEAQQDWRYWLMTFLIDNERKYVGVPSIIPIITHYDFISSDQDMIHP